MPEAILELGTRAQNRRKPDLLDGQVRAAVERAGRRSRLTLLLPIIVFQAYLLLTVLLYAFGPWPYRMSDPTELYLFLAAAHLALLLGYLSAYKRKGRDYKGELTVREIAGASIVVSLLLLIPTATYRVGLAPGDVLSGDKSLGNAYNAAWSGIASSTPIIEYVRFFFGPLTVLPLPLTVFYWRYLPKSMRLLGLASILGTVLIYVFMGTNKALADTVVLVPSTIAAAQCAGLIRLKMKRLAILAVVIVVGAFTFFSFFSASVLTREGSGFKYGFNPAGNVFADNDNILIRDLPQSAKFGVLALTSYLTQGYYAVYLSLDKPFVFTFGVGNSTFLSRQAARLSGDGSLLNSSYPFRIEEDGWNAMNYWSSIYPWIASDVTFPGTIVVVFLIGRMFALTWIDSLKATNPFAVVMFIQICLMLFYFSCNNQCLQSGESLTGFYVTLAMWLFTRSRSGKSRQLVQGT